MSSLKTFVARQAHQKPEALSYQQSVAQIINKDGGGTRGAMGVFGRGLGGRIAASGVQVSLSNLAKSLFWIRIPPYGDVLCDTGKYEC